jgi:phosphate transport system substrate-binding protein
MRSKTLTSATVVAAVLAGSTAYGAEITGAGSTFAYPVLSKWSAGYQKATGNGLNYQSIGSGAGIKLIEANTVTFGASDQPLKVADLDKNGLTQFPMIMGGIVPVVNIQGVKAGELVFDGPTLAAIYLGKITKWSDPLIAKLNPTVKLPNLAISVVERSDGSGTTFNFADYLVKVSDDWKSQVGESTALQWPTGVGAKGSEGVAGAVMQTDGAIGYVEYAYAKQNNMVYADMINKDGDKVAPTMDTFQAAASNADWANAPGFYQILTYQPGAQSWPITATTFALLHKQPKDADASKQAIAFFSWAFSKGQKDAQSLDYIPLPKNVVELIKKNSWSTIQAN